MIVQIFYAVLTLSVAVFTVVFFYFADYINKRLPQWEKKFLEPKEPKPLGRANYII